MRFLAAICLLLSGSAFAERIPARDPFFGESRPDWWWDIWHGRVVVLEGKITFKKSEEPDIRIEINKERIKEIIPNDKTRALQLKMGEFYVGEIEISKFHYADGCASDSNGTLQEMRSGKLKRAKVLIPIMRFGERAALYGRNLKPDVENIGIHVFDYSDLIFGVYLAHSSKIPNDNLVEAQEVFKIREKLVHSGVNRITLPDRGYAGFHFKMEGSAVQIESVVQGSPAEKGGLRTGDVILSMNGEKIEDQDHSALGKLSSLISKFKVDEQIEIEAQRGSERLAFQIKLISMADLEKLMNSPKGGADQPAVNPGSKSVDDKPQPESEKPR